MRHLPLVAFVVGVLCLGSAIPALADEAPVPPGTAHEPESAVASDVPDAIVASRPNAHLSLSDRGLGFLERHEGFSAQVYNDTAGNCTIGYGHLLHYGGCTAADHRNWPHGISRARARQLLRSDARVAERAVRADVTVRLNQHQFDTLVSFTFNVGTHAFKTSTLLRVLNQGHYDQVPAQLNALDHRWPRKPPPRRGAALEIRSVHLTIGVRTACDHGHVFSLSRADIEATYAVIKPFIRQTPIVQTDGADFGLPSFPLTFKLEHLQHAGSFKTRGAFTNLLTREVPPAGVVAASGGNHGAAVAYAAMRRRVPAKIFVPTVSSPAKIDRIRQYGADLVVGGDRYADALAASEQWAAESGAMPVHAFDQIETLLGQATIGLELSAQAPGLDSLLVAVGGGGLIGGIAAWYAARIKVIGVEPVDAPTLTRALTAGQPVDSPTGSIAADSLAPRRVGELMFSIAQRYIERVVVVDDAAIVAAQQALWSTLRLVVEPGGAAATAALLSGAYVPSPGESVGVVISGANTTAVDFDRSS